MTHPIPTQFLLTITFRTPCQAAFGATNPWDYRVVLRAAIPGLCVGMQPHPPPAT